MDHSWEMRGFTYPTYLPTCTGLKIYRVHRVGDHLHMRDDIMKTDPVLLYSTDSYHYISVLVDAPVATN